MARKRRGGWGNTEPDAATEESEAAEEHETAAEDPKVERSRLEVNELGKVVVTFRGPWTKYQPGDIAGFEPHLARQLLGMQTVDTRGHKSPLCVRGANLSVLERIGITKSKGANSEPLGGTEERKVVGPDSAELVGGPAHPGK